MNFIYILISKNNFRKATARCHLYSIIKITKKNYSKKLNKHYVMLPSRSVLLFLILKICKKKIDFKQVNKNLFIPVTPKNKI
jgi:hypothetical protein